MNKQTDNVTAANDATSAESAAMLHHTNAVVHPQNYQTSNLKSPQNQTPTPQKQHLPSPRSIKLPKTLSNFIKPKTRNPLFFGVHASPVYQFLALRSTF
jgi:hypothetical protein